MIKAVIFDMYETLVSLYTFPVYLGKQVAEDIGISEAEFRKTWDPTEDDRTIGKMHFEDVIKQVLEEHNAYSDELFNKITGSRKNNTKHALETMHPEVIPMLQKLKAGDKKIALITNCFFEERDTIVKSELWKYFDCACLSCELGIKKPDLQIFEKCLQMLELKPEECLYIGDGGSLELETARDIGMKTAQACWYLKDGTRQPVGRKPEFIQLESPIDVCTETLFR